MKCDETADPHTYTHGRRGDASSSLFFLLCSALSFFFFLSSCLFSSHSSLFIPTAVDSFFLFLFLFLSAPALVSSRLSSLSPLRIPFTLSHCISLYHGQRGCPVPPVFFRLRSTSRPSASYTCKFRLCDAISI